MGDGGDGTGKLFFKDFKGTGNLFAATGNKRESTFPELVIWVSRPSPT